MSQDSAFSFSTSHNEQDGTKRQGTLSLAGPNYYQQLPGSYYKPQSFVTPEYQAYQAGYERPEEPIWGLAKPLPHVIRPRMKASEGERSQISQQRPESLSNVVSGATAPPQNTDPATAQSRKLGSSNITKVVSSPSHLQSRRPETERGSLSGHPGGTQDVQRTATHDFGYRSNQAPEGKDLELTQSEDEQIAAGRERLQAFADAFPSNKPEWNRTGDVDWEEFSQKNPLAQAQTSSPSAPEELKFFNTWSKFRYHYREILAEFLGTFIFMIFGLCASLVPTIAPDDPSGSSYGNFISTSLGWSWGGMVAIYIAGGVSGAHLNPATSITLSIFRGFPWRSCWQYILAQFLAAFLAALVVYGLYSDAITLAVTSSPQSTCSTEASCLKNVFYATPHSSLPTATVLFTQFLAAALYNTSVFALGDDRNAPPGAGMNALIIGLLIFVVCAAFPYNTALNISPARDFGPRLAIAMIWSDGSLFTDHSWYWLWGCWIAPLIGSIVGGGLYDVLIFTGMSKLPSNIQRTRQSSPKSMRHSPRPCLCLSTLHDSLYLSLFIQASC